MKNKTKMTQQIAKSHYAPGKKKQLETDYYLGSIFIELFTIPASLC